MSGDARSDAELLAASARAEGAAFGVLVRRYIRAGTLLAAQLLGDRDDAEDVVQDAFGVVYRDARSFDAARPFAPWFYAIVRRIAANRRARDTRRARLLQLFGTEPDTAAPAAESAIMARLDAESAKRAMAELSPMQRACFELVAVRGLSNDEVAEMHGISASTVRQHVFRARAVLKESLGGVDD